MANIQDLWVRKDKTRTAQYGKGKRWVVNWVEPDGTRQRESFPSKDAAKSALVDVEASLQNGTYHSRKAGAQTIAAWAEVWFDAQVHQRAGSVGNIRTRLDRSIIPTLGQIPLRDLTRANIQDAVNTWSKTLAPATVKTTYVYLTGMLKHAVLDQHLRVSPAVKIKLPQVEPAPVRPLTVETVQALVGTIWAPFRVAVVFAAASGLRPSELFGLTWDRVDLKTGLVVVDRQLVQSSTASEVKFGPLKTLASYRTVKIGAATISTLTEHAKNGADGLVFHREGKPCQRQARSQVWRTAASKLPEIGSGWHQLRHHHASLLIAAGLSPVAVAHRLGHKDARETLKTYAHLWPDDDDRMVAASDGLVSMPKAVNTH